MFLEEYEKDKEAEWDKIESYFIDLEKLPKTKNRIVILLFKLGFEHKHESIFKEIQQFLGAFTSIMENKKFLKILGSALRFGNCLNAGNKTRGQADGFALDNLFLIRSIKDSEGKPILQRICETHCSEDEEFYKIREDFNDVFKSYAKGMDLFPMLIAKVDKFKKECQD